MLQLNTEIRAVDKNCYSQGFSSGFAQNERICHFKYSECVCVWLCVFVWKSQCIKMFVFMHKIKFYSLNKIIDNIKMSISWQYMVFMCGFHLKATVSPQILGLWSLNIYYYYMPKSLYHHFNETVSIFWQANNYIVVYCLNSKKKFPFDMINMRI